ncbi:MAG: hypothetical protein ACLGJB_03045 [Blastocatellia bacterium]
MRSKRSSAARMVQQMRLGCVDCSGRAFYGSSRGPVCYEHKWDKKQATTKANKIDSKRG